MSNAMQRSLRRNGLQTVDAGLPVFAGLQAGFARALLDPGSPIPRGLIAPDGNPSAKRFSVYRNNVVVGLIEALKAAYPVVHRLVGEEFFVGMARIHALHSPPRSPVMLDYGVQFPDFIASFEQAASLAYLADIARLERLWVEAYHAPEADPVALEELERFPEAAVASCRLAIHPAVRILRSRHPVLEIWRANTEGDGKISIPADFAGEELLIARPLAEVEIRRLPPGAAAFIEALLDGKTLFEALRQGLLGNAQFEPDRALAGLFEADIVIGMASLALAEPAPH